MLTIRDTDIILFAAKDKNSLLVCPPRQDAFNLGHRAGLQIGSSSIAAGLTDDKNFRAAVARNSRQSHTGPLMPNIEH